MGEKGRKNFLHLLSGLFRSNRFQSSLRSFLANKDARGCTVKELEVLESRFNAKLPAEYKEFLVQAGHGVEELWRGSDYMIDRLPDMQEAARGLLEDVHQKLPNGAFVFYMHQGYQFFFLTNDGVFFFHEGYPLFTKEFESFAEFIQATIG